MPAPVRRRFAGISDTRNPPGTADVDRLRASAGAPAADVRSFISRGFALAWTGHAEAGTVADGPVVVVDGDLYSDGASAGVVGDPAATLRTAVRSAVSVDAALAAQRGDFVAVVHDPRTATTVLARDHLGGRGLVWWVSGSRVYFASEIVDVLGLIPSMPGPDVASLAHYLGLGGMPTDRTLYAGIRRVEGAHALVLEPRREPTVRAYWNPTYVDVTPGSLDDHADGLRAVLRTAVERRSEGPSYTGIQLSGGLDSSSVAGVGSTLASDRRPSRAYSAVFPDHPSIDESELIAEVCGQVGLTSRSVSVRSGSVVSGAIPYIQAWRVPPVSPNLFFWSRLLGLAAADGVGTLLDGEGGDELFGLSPYLIGDLLRHGRLRAASDLVRRAPGGRPDLPAAAVRRWLYRYGVLGLLPPWLDGSLGRRRRGAGHVPDWLGPALAVAYESADRDSDWKRYDGPLWWARVVELVVRGMGASLMHDHVRRRAAMAGLEPRHPLVDVDVIEYVLRCPPELAWDTRFSRPVLRAAVAGLVPDAVRLRPEKSTFDAVFHEALGGPDLPVVRSLLAPDEARIGAYVDLHRVHADLLADVVSDRLAWGIAVWRLVTVECWLRAQEADGLDAWLADAGLAPAVVEEVGPSDHGGRHEQPPSALS